MRTVTPAELSSRASDAAMNLLDVRSPGEFQSIHAIGAVNIPLGQITKEAVAAHFDLAQPLYVICRGGNRSQSACAQLDSLGVSDVINIAGGTLAWQAAGLPVEKGEGIAGNLNLALVIATLGFALAYFADSLLFGIWGVFLAAATYFGLMDGCPICVAIAKLTGIGKCRNGNCST